MLHQRHLLLLSSFLLLASCDGPADPADSGPPDAAPATCASPPPTFETGDPNGHADPLRAGAGQARAGRLTEAQLPADATGLGVWETGDFVLANERVALLIEDAGASDLYDPFGGRPVGIATVRDGMLVEAGDFNEILFGFGGFLVETESVTVLNDGSDGGPAVIRATGPLGALAFAGDLLAEAIPSGDYTGLPAAMDYELSGDDDAVDVYLSVSQPEPAAVRVPFLVTGFFQRYRMPIWIEDGGFAVPSAAFALSAFVDDGATSYAWLAPEGGTLSVLLDQSGVLVASGGRAVVPGCESVRFPLGTMVIGGPGLAGLQRSIARHRGETLRTVQGTVTSADGSPAPDVRLHVRRADGRHFARLAPEADGTFSVGVPNEAIAIFAHRAGTPLVGPIDVAAASDTADVVMPAFGTIHVAVTDAAPPNDPIPARVQVLPVGGAPELPGDLGERSVGAGRAHVAFTADGTIDLVVAPGMHDVIVSRGYEYELVSERVNVTADTVVDVSAALDHVVDTTGVMCADYHIHTHRSPDSPDSPQLKLLGLIADGLEIPIRSDHEWINDFQPMIESMGLSAYAFAIGGEELTTFAYGHFGVFPVTEDRSRPSGGAISWVGRLPPAVFADVRARPEAPVLIINHPRSGGVFGGYFNAAAFDRTTGMAGNADHWDEEFTLVEVFNDASFEESRDSTVADWFALLRSGRRVFAVGSSDSHNIYGSPVGYPRTCLALGTDDPLSLSVDAVRDATSTGASTISGGVYLTVVGPGGAGPGSDVTGAGAVASFDVVVRAASWIPDLTGLEVIVDGVTVETIPITEADRDPTDPTVRLRAVGVSAPVDASGSWVVFHVGSDGDLAPLHPGRSPFAVSNPVFLTR